jgi:hypothetical protein
MSHDYSKNPPGIPLVVQVGFSGKRTLYDPKKDTGSSQQKLEAEFEVFLTKTLLELPEMLGLSPNHRLCGVSQVAIGADMVFTRVCHKLHGESDGRDFKQRILLPQPTEGFLTATSEKGTADFTTEQATAARNLLKLEHIIEVRPVSTSVHRTEQFQDAILELARVSDVCIAVIRADEAAEVPVQCDNSGGTVDFIRCAAKRDRPVLVITFSVEDGCGKFEGKWEWNCPRKVVPRPPICVRFWRLLTCPDHRAKPAAKKEGFTPPALPAVLDGCTVRSDTDYGEDVKAFAGRKAKRHQWLFMGSALIIILTHVIATALAVVWLCHAKSNGQPEHASVATQESAAVPAACHATVDANKGWEFALLQLEAVFLLIGWGVHFGLHLAHAVRKWAISRLIAETARSVTNMNGAHGYLGHMFMLSMPEFLRHLLRTLNYFHLCNTRRLRPDDWKERRWTYIKKRLTEKGRGQLDYYKRKRDKANCWLRCANLVFWIGTGCAIIATWIELAHSGKPHGPQDGAFQSSGDWLSLASILLPVLSVAALSLAASFDFEARLHTYTEMVDFLRQQRKFLARANSDHEFATLVLQTETRLVGENVNWFSRRAFTGVA